ncbi:hypothetical protein H257_01367 [Aphanomyces astaci]|uniref:Uncharacterized protein n=1 Tax=Aphanomyces astaci TaxID=112090 RepID=W4H9L8_APHAT|nr:hypothetical protein H257_01367 [Aphanomyces astaci]ETV87969.1 hypothetical protein H257_01367 [Aphanomyces astaci]|eukprot:XP_009822832.1 hypothetical protein H257_01367 [Aphanomyces astaci]
MPSVAPTGDLLFCCGTSSSLEPKRGRSLQHPAKKLDRKQPKAVPAYSLFSPRTDDDMEKMVDVLRKSLHLTKPSTAPASSLPHGVVKRRVYLSPRERVHSSAIRHNMSVLGAPPAALRQTSPGVDKLPTLAKPIESTARTSTPDPDERSEGSPNQAAAVSTTPRLFQSKSADDILSNNATNAATLIDHSKSCSDLDTIRSQLAFGGFHVEFEEPETTEDNAPTSPIGPWMNQGDGVLRQVAATASSPRSRLLSLSVDPGGPKDPRRPKTSVKVVPPQRKKPTPSKKKQPSRPTSSASSVDPTTLDL